MLEIRRAEENDIPLILQFITKLAVYEKEPEAVKATADDLLRDGFSGKPKFYVDIAYWSGAPAGFAFYFYTYSTWQGRSTLFLEDLFVDEDKRGHAIGKSLLKHLAKTAIDQNCSRMEWMCLDWNQKSIDFYKSFGSDARTDWVPFRLSGTRLIEFSKES